jgi:hypothetical protein
MVAEVLTLEESELKQINALELWGLAAGRSLKDCESCVNIDHNSS